MGSSSRSNERRIQTSSHGRIPAKWHSSLYIKLALARMERNRSLNRTRRWVPLFARSWHLTRFSGPLAWSKHMEYMAHTADKWRRVGNKSRRVASLAYTTNIKICWVTEGRFDIISRKKKTNLLLTKNKAVAYFVSRPFSTFTLCHFRIVKSISCRMNYSSFVSNETPRVYIRGSFLVKYQERNKIRLCL